ncbi:Thiol:disulfide interchange protein DsbD precursor [Sodalis glossinidius str. 'morsitans']|uniref:Suppressor for copper-sensitivity B n=1 Tax=Sodalis glossinidius (strain morsitans) TaxID=343509 RepID=Q2NUY1_SODGM|nr:protein-disulfide reductase DsbD domain-containing protein [Sodalis glossinidius]BAE74044.1 suppressor for copper-sensitivity B [Sodalis glossinidius str. 'morsitans']CRL44602.1 Thiol:disulfide interchange protein DsbD precursor [Sodalis glossinidius str. 'morsitans']
MNVLIRSLMLLLAGCAFVAQAADSGWLRNEQNSHAEVRLRSAVQGQDQQLLLDIRLQPGWKTYWRTPGEGGVAPDIRWQTTGAEAQWYWPTPARFDVSGLTTQGYKGDITLPIEIRKLAGSTLAGTLTLSTCSDVCILTDFPFSLDLSKPTDDSFARDYARAMGQIPPTGGLTDKLDASFINGELQIRAQRQQGWHQPELFFDYPQGSMLAAPQISVKGDTFEARVPVTDEWGETAPDLRGKTLSMVIADGGMAQQSSVVLSSQPLLDGKGVNTTFWSVLLLALLGGLILNLMPCVLPVLAIKLSSLVQQQGQTRHQTRQQFLASSAGILFSFLLLALLMTGLRLSGQALGWGIQFQSGGFLLLMALVMFLFSASLFDLLHFRLPSGLNTRLATVGGNGLTGHFGQGAFATLLATPCSAPFLGTAAAYALTAPLPQLWLLFAALGIGMSLPWLLVAALPGLARCLPHPGRWMMHLRTVLALLMLMATMWLVTLLIPHWGATFAGVLAALLVLVLAVWLISRRALQQAGITLITLTLAGALFLITRIEPEEETLHWQPLTEAAINQALQQNRRVFVDVTADWCITCKVNKSRVLSQPDVRKALQADDVVLLQGDWTRPDPAISEFLRRRDSVAIPFNQIYGPAMPQSRILSPLLSRDAVISTLSEAKK